PDAPRLAGPTAPDAHGQRSVRSAGPPSVHRRALARARIATDPLAARRAHHGVPLPPNHGARDPRGYGRLGAGRPPGSLPEERTGLRARPPSSRLSPTAFIRGPGSRSPRDRSAG